MSYCENYCGELFSLNGAAPRYLPAIVRLENGQTRNVKLISLDELNSLGYYGPISVPSYDDETQYLEWDSHSYSFTVRSRVSPFRIFQIDDEEDYKVRLSLNAEVENIKQKLQGSLTNYGVLRYTARYKYLTQVLDSTDPLRFADIEKFTEEDVFDPARLAEIQSEFEQSNPISSGCYHYFGFVPFLGNDLNADTFVLNEAWTQNLDNNVVFTIVEKDLSASGTVVVSGYNVLTGDSTFEILPGQVEPLLFNGVYFPHD